MIINHYNEACDTEITVLRSLSENNFFFMRIQVLPRNELFDLLIIFA